MGLRAVLLASLLVATCLGCQSILNSPPEPSPATATGAAPKSIEVTLSKPEPTQAATPAALSTQAPARLLRSNHLTLAAACLSQGNDVQACEHLRQFIAVEPEHRNARFFYAELLFQRGDAGAREHFQQLAAAAQEENPIDVRHLIHCHGRLLALAESADDDYEVHLQRGLGLVWLTQARAQLGDPAGTLPVEALLCKAAGSLGSAHALRPEAARPCWYLHKVWRQLAQPSPSERWLREAQEAAPFSDLTPAEQRSLLLADAANRLRHYPY